MSCSHLPGVTCDSCRYLTTAERSLVADSTYTDDVIAVMRDTITALREQVRELRRTNNDLLTLASRALDTINQDAETVLAADLRKAVE